MCDHGVCRTVVLCTERASALIGGTLSLSKAMRRDTNELNVTTHTTQLSLQFTKLIYMMCGDVNSIPISPAKRSDSITLRAIPVIPSRSESESELLYDWRFTTNQFVLATSPVRLTTNTFFNWTLVVIVLCNILPDKRMGLSFTIAAGSRQRSHSQVRVSRDSQPHFTVTDVFAHNVYCRFCEVILTSLCVCFSLCVSPPSFSLFLQSMSYQRKVDD
jgi:hypothetical protein